MHGEIDFFGAPELTVDWVVKHYLSGEKGNVVAMNQPAEDEPIYIIFNSQHPDGMKYADSFRQALSKLISDGSYLEILKKYMGDQRASAYMKRMLKFHH